MVKRDAAIERRSHSDRTALSQQRSNSGEAAIRWRGADAPSERLGAPADAWGEALPTSAAVCSTAAAGPGAAISTAAVGPGAAISAAAAEEVPAVGAGVAEQRSSSDRARSDRASSEYSALIPLLQRQVLCVDTTASTPSTLR